MRSLAWTLSYYRDVAYTVVITWNCPTRCLYWLVTRFLGVADKNLSVKSDLSCTISELRQLLCSPDPPLFNTNFLGGGCSRCTRSPTLGLASAWALSYLAVKLFSKNFNLCDHGTVPDRHGRSDRRTDGRTTWNLITALCVASRGKNVESKISQSTSARQIEQRVLCAFRYKLIKQPGNDLCAGEFTCFC